MGAVKLNLAKILGRSHAKPSLYVNVDSSSKSDIKGSKATGALIYSLVPEKDETKVR